MSATLVYVQTQKLLFSRKGLFTLLLETVENCAVNRMCVVYN